jgi:hypothetical protein
VLNIFRDFSLDKKSLKMLEEAFRNFPWLISQKVFYNPFEERFMPETGSGSGGLGWREAKRLTLVSVLQIEGTQIRLTRIVEKS